METIEQQIASIPQKFQQPMIIPYLGGKVKLSPPAQGELQGGGKWQASYRVQVLEDGKKYEVSAQALKALIKVFSEDPDAIEFLKLVPEQKGRVINTQD